MEKLREKGRNSKRGFMWSLTPDDLTTTCTECADWRDVAISLAHNQVLLGFISNQRPHVKKGNHWLWGKALGTITWWACALRFGVYFFGQNSFVSSYNRILCLYNKIYLADFLKTNLTKFAVISLKTRQNRAGFLNPRSFKIVVTKEKERR